MIKSTPKAPAIVSDTLAVVYEALTGKVRHMHQVTILESGEIRTDNEIKKAALEYSAKLHPNLNHGDLRAVLVQPETLRPGTLHVVDLKTLKLVSAPAARPK